MLVFTVAFLLIYLSSISIHIYANILHSLERITTCLNVV